MDIGIILGLLFGGSLVILILVFMIPFLHDTNVAMEELELELYQKYYEKECIELEPLYEKAKKYWNRYGILKEVYQEKCLP